MRDLGRCFKYSAKEKTLPFTQVRFLAIRRSPDFHHIWSLSMKFHRTFLSLAILFCAGSAWAQTDTSGAEEDFSQYENLGFADDGAKRFCTSKVLDLSPQKLISIGIDFQGPHNMSLDTLYGADGNLWSNPVERRMAHNRGLRIAASIPVISKNSIIWTLGGYYWENLYKQKSTTGILPAPHEFDQWLQQGIRTTAINTTVFKPVNDKTFWLFQAQAEVNGDYGWSNVGTAMEQMKFGGAVLYGKKPHDRLQWAVGAVQTCCTITPGHRGNTEPKYCSRHAPPSAAPSIRAICSSSGTSWKVLRIGCNKALPWAIPATAISNCAAANCASALPTNTACTASSG